MVHVRRILPAPLYANHQRLLSPFAGINYSYTKYTQTSAGVGNLLRTQVFGPEVGFNWSICAARDLRWPNRRHVVKLNRGD
jgi:hypothetical protein